ncbi:MAG: sigma-54-dependent Fis family transcriptional regulator [Deltaproteobacteria bacterium]|nr:sigma-54-dependent Fis family transcriptional regulator [Deltaproteobacteria bacterium]
MARPLIGVSENIVKVREVINHVANTGLNTVIYGESGVGKEVVAQDLYQKSPRNGNPFIKVNCAALPDGLLESELFGYEKGAFTGADKKTRGKFELANKGVLMLDEIGDMSLPLQAKLLHVLQGGQFSPLGSEKEVITDTWVIAATNHDLEQNIQDGKFREDLYYRLNIIKIYLKPLRERPEDIPHLIDYYLKEYSLLYNANNLVQPSNRVISELASYTWPGNVRELQNILKRMLVLGDAEKIIDELKNRNEGSNSTASKSSGTNAASFSEILDLEGSNSPDSDTFSLKKIRKAAIDRVEKEIIAHVLDKTDWNRSKATKILKISYKTLLYKISDLGITPPKKYGE